MLTRAALASDLRARAFGLDGLDQRPSSLGLEIELLPLRAGDHSVPPLFGEAGTTAWVRKAGLQHGWREQVAIGQAPRFITRSGGKLSFEPGGQIEYSSPTYCSANGLLSDVVSVATLLQEAAESEGIELLTCGIDPYNDLDAAPLQLTASRYANMARYFDTIGPAGARMMRQTVAVQVNLAHGPDPIRRWRLLNRMAAPLIALFANSRRYAGRDTEHASYRTQVWRETDPARTGVFRGASDPVEEYLDFALDAPTLLSPFGDHSFRPFRDWMAEGAQLSDWRGHLTTLFPEIRPKGYFEIRSVDAQPPGRYGALTALLCGVVLDEIASQEAERVLPAATPALLERAGKQGVADAQLFDVCQQLTGIAVQGCQRLGGDFLDGVHLDHAQQEWTALLRATPPFSGAGDSSARTRLRR